MCQSFSSWGFTEHFLFHFFFIAFVGIPYFFTLKLLLTELKGCTCREYLSLAFIPGYLDSCSRAFMFVLTFMSPCPMVQLILEKHLALLLHFCEQFYGLHVRGRVLICYLSISQIVTAEMVLQLWADHQMICSAKAGLFFKTFPAASCCSIALWISV